MAAARAPITDAVRRAVEDLIHAAARSIDDDRLEDFPAFFVEDGIYKVASRFNVDRGLPLAQINCTNRGMIVDRVAALRQANIYQPHCYRHLIGGILVTPGAERSVAARSNYLVVRTMEDGASTLFSIGEYRDVIAMGDDGPRFRERVVVFDSKSIETLLVIPL
jgi:anthranilate 1,2-dioxygenase small subunit